MDKAAITADYVDIRFIKSRKVAVISLEIPIEAATAFVETFGTPAPDITCPVALARLEPVSIEKRRARKMEDLSLPQQAALLGERESFWRFLEDRYSFRVETKEHAAEIIRGLCAVQSRSDITPGSPAAVAFLGLQSDFDLWMRMP